VPVITSVVAFPGVKVTLAVSVIELPSRVAETVAVPALVPAVSVAVYVPLLLSVVAVVEPRELLITTVPSETVTRLEFESLSVTVTVVVADPSA